MAKRKSNESPVSDLIDLMMSQYGLSEGYKEYQLIQAWSEVAGVMVANRTSSIRIQHGIYYVTIDSPALRSELSFLRAGLLQRLNEIAGSRFPIKDIVFR
jgi:hypothetical protein